MISIGLPGVIAATAQTFVRTSAIRMTAAMAISIANRRGLVGDADFDKSVIG
jgi:hypothetical protein